MMYYSTKRKMKLVLYSILFLILLIVGYFGFQYINSRNDYYISKGIYYEKNGNLAEAKQNYIDAIEKNPNDYRGHALLGKIYLLENELENSKSELLKAEELNDNNELINIGLASIYFLENDIEKSENEMRNALKKNPHNSLVNGMIGGLYFVKNDTEKAESYLKYSLKHNPYEVLSLQGMSAINLKQNNLEKGKEFLDKALKIEENNSLTHYGLSNYYYLKGEYDNALKEIKIAKKFQISDIESRMYIGAEAVYLYETGKIEESLTNIQKLEKYKDTDKCMYHLSQGYKAMFMADFVLAKEQINVAKEYVGTNSSNAYCGIFIEFFIEQYNQKKPN